MKSRSNSKSARARAVAAVVIGFLGLPLELDPRGRAALPASAPPQIAGPAPCVNGTAGGFPCANIDLAAHMPLSVFSSVSGNDIWGWTDPMTNREYALMGLNDGIGFVDVTVPDQPVYLGKLPFHPPVSPPPGASADDDHAGNSLWRDVEVFADHAFVVADNAGNHGMQVFDLRQLRTVANPPATFAETAHYAGFGSAHTITLNPQTGFAYVNGTSRSGPCAGGPVFVDVRTPAAPVMAGCFSADGYTHDNQCVTYNGPDLAHVGREICFASNEDRLTIVDVTNKAAPVIESRNTYMGSGFTHQGWLTPNHAYFLLDDEFDEMQMSVSTRTHIWDVRDLHAPRRIGIYEAATGAIDHQQFVVGNYLYQSNYRAGLRILDVSGIANGVLREVAYFDVVPADDAAQFSGTWSNYPFFPSGTVVVSGIEQGMFILRPNLTPAAMGLPNFLFSPSAETFTVPRGQTANIPLSLAAQNGFAGAVTLTCSGLPLHASCVFPQNPIMPSTLPMTTTIMLRTTATTSTAPDTPSAATPDARTLALPASGLLLLPLVSGKGWRSRDSRARRGLLLTVMALALASFACGGGTSPVVPPPPPPPPPAAMTTPPGSYPITVTATAGALRHTVNIILTVQ